MAALTVEFPQTVWTVEFGGDEIVVAPVTMAPGAPGGGGAVDSVNGQTGTVVLDLDDLTDVDTTTDPPDADDVLAWDGTLWTPAALTAADTGAIPASLIDAKGDLLVGTANDTAARLGVGSNGQVLTADSTQTAGVKWAAAGVSTPEWTVIAERDISSTSASERFDSTTNADPTSYKELRLSIVGQCVDTASSQTQIGLRLNNDTGSSNYLWAETTRGGGASTLSQASGSSFYLGKLASQLTNSTRAGLIDVAFSAISTSWRHPIRSDFAEEDSNSTNQVHYLVGMLGGAHIGTGAITRVDVFPLSGSGFAAGTRIRLSGRA